MPLLSTDRFDSVSTRDHIVFYLNGNRLAVRGSDCFLTLGDLLRNRLRKTGTKIVCNEGDCGACSVLVGRPDESFSRLEYDAIDSCIAFVSQLDRTHVVTVEGLSKNCDVSPIQEAMVNCHGSQCGFCTPGFVTTLHGMVECSQPLDERSLRYGLSGNLCRCTGYSQIIEAGQSVVAAEVPRISSIYAAEPMLADFGGLGDKPVVVQTESRTLVLPQTLRQAIEFRSQLPDAVIISGGTDYGVLHNHGRTRESDVICLTSVNEGRVIEVKDGELVIGALATWDEIELAVETLLPTYHDILTRFGSPQIRKMGTIGGNLASGSPIADSVPLHLVLNSELTLASMRGTRRIPLRDFYLGYRKTLLEPDELITSVLTPLPQAGEQVKLYKISKRRDMDISTLTFAIWIKAASQTIEDCRIAVGGVGPTVTRLVKAEGMLRDQSWSEAAFRAAGRVAKSEVTPWTDVRGSADYRLQLTENLLIKFFLEANEAVAT
jgi:xanthine dehydrogenase small subunit